MHWHRFTIHFESDIQTGAVAIVRAINTERATTLGARQLRGELPVLIGTRRFVVGDPGKGIGFDGRADELADLWIALRQLHRAPVHHGTLDRKTEDEDHEAGEGDEEQQRSKT